MKRSLSFFFMVIFIFQILTSPISLGAQVILKINNQQKVYDQEPILIGNRVFVPLRGIFEDLGAEVQWDAQDQTVTAQKGSTVVKIQIGNTNAIVNDKNVTMDQAPQIRNRRTVVPIRFVSEALGAIVDWDNSSRTVFIYTEESSKEFAFRGIALGTAEERVLEQLGTPARKDSSEYGFQWYIYNQDYKQYIQVGIQSGRVVAVYTNAANWKSAQGVQIGTKKSVVNQKYGKSLEYILKGNTRYMMGEKDGQDVFLIENGYVTIFYDLHNDNTVTSVQIIEKNTEEALKGFYGPSSLALQQSFERQVFDLSNAIRARNNKPIFLWDEAIAVTARKHSVDMAQNNYFDHTNQRSQSPFDRMKQDGIRYSLAAENIAAGQPSGIFAHEGWMNSLGHRNNILGDCQRLGVGVHFGGSYNTYYTQNFFTPR